MEPYRDALAPIRNFADSMDGAQAGDPAKAAAAVERALMAERTPMRLPLGAE